MVESVSFGGFDVDGHGVEVSNGVLQLVFDLVGDFRESTHEILHDAQAVRIRSKRYFPHSNCER